MGIRMGIDIGGTFTDLYVHDEVGGSRSVKVPTTPDDLTMGVLAAIDEAAETYDTTADELLNRTEQLIHGTTVSTNAILEGDVAKTALICTEGFRDVLWFREGGKEKPYDLHVDYPDPYVPRALTFGVPERVNAEGDIEVALEEAAVRAVIRRLENRNVEAVAVALLWSHANPDHELRIGELLEEHLPGVPYSLSHRVNPIIREYRRTSSTVINASVHDLVNEYFSRLEEILRSNGFSGDPLIITANGGVMTPEEVARTPIWTVDSGPTMLPIATHRYTSTELDEDNVIALDMGGTSLDMGVVIDGTVPRTREAKVGEEYMMGIEKVEVQSIGSGGGSIAWVDDGGMLHVGPESAGADPGPVCYGRGGQRPTVTDAALVLGYLNPSYFLGGDMELDPDAAREAIVEQVAKELDISAVDAAYSVYLTANQDMVNGIEGITIENGIDPRNHVLSGGGGALGMHIVPIARELQINEILLPAEAGVVSSIGGVLSDIRRDFSSSSVTTSDDFDHSEVNSVLGSLRKSADEFFRRTDISESNRSISYFTEARYPYQIWELEVELPVTEIAPGDETVLAEEFHRTHEATYGFRTDEPVEFLYWRVEANGKTGGDVESGGQPEDRASTYDEREAFFGGTRIPADAFRAEALGAGQSIEGPAFIDASNTTVVLPPESDLTVTSNGNYHIRT